MLSFSIASSFSLYSEAILLFGIHKNKKMTRTVLINSSYCKQLLENILQI